MDDCHHVASLSDQSIFQTVIVCEELHQTDEQYPVIIHIGLHTATDDHHLRKFV